MRRLFLTVLVALVLGAWVGADGPAVSSAGVAALTTWHLPVAPNLEPYFDASRTRRFAEDVVTWRALEPASRQAASMRKAARFWNEILRLRGAGAFRFMETAHTDTTAVLTVFRASSIPIPAEHGGGTYAIGCGQSVQFPGPDNTYASGWIVSNPNKSGCDGERILMHEVGHFVTTLLHPTTGIMAKAFAGCPQYNARLTPEQNALDPRWEGPGGLFEAAAWVATHPAGSLPPQ